MGDAAAPGIPHTAPPTLRQLRTETRAGRRLDSGIRTGPAWQQHGSRQPHHQGTDWDRQRLDRDWKRDPVPAEHGSSTGSRQYQRSLRSCPREWSFTFPTDSACGYVAGHAYSLPTRQPSRNERASHLRRTSVESRAILWEQIGPGEGEGGSVRSVERWTGAEARALRQAMRWSVRTFANRLGISARTVSKWEAGGSQVNPRPEMQAILDTALSRADEEAAARFGAILASISSQKRSSCAEGVHANTATAVAIQSSGLAHGDALEFDAEDDNVHRQEFIATAAMASVGLVLPQLTCSRQVDMSTLDALRSRTARLRCLDDYLGGADTYRLYLEEFRSTAELVRNRSYTEQVEGPLLALVAEQAQQAGWAAFDAGRQGEAKRLYEISLSAADESGNAGLKGNALAFLAYQETSTARPGLELALASWEAGREAHPTVRALLLERLAWTQAVAGQSRDVDAALDLAREALEVKGEGPPPDWAAWVDLNEIQIMSGRCWTELRRPLRAVGVLEHALARYDDTHARDKSLYLTWLAHAYYQGGEIEQAARVTARAVDLANGVGSVRPAQRMAPLLRKFGNHQSVGSVAELLDRTAHWSHISASGTDSTDDTLAEIQLR